MRKIVDSITKLQELNDSEKSSLKGAEEFEFRVPFEGVIREGNSKLDVRMPWVTNEKIVFRRLKKERVVTAAELSLPELVLKRLKSDAVKLTKWVKVKKAGVTQTVVDEIKMIWRTKELVMVKFDLPLCHNMDRAQEIIELKTGGLVVWRKKDTLVVYRGFPYESPSNNFAKLHLGLASDEEPSPSKIVLPNSQDVSAKYLISRVARKEEISGRNIEQNSLFTGIEENVSLQSVHGTLYQREADRLLDGLGPRFIDWWWPKPLPVDADLLPEVIPGFTPPIRRCPPRVRSQLADEELTYFRKLARPLPTHFALGRNTRLQGLAAAIIKLWEKSLIVKIAVKWGVPNTNNEQMAWELKRLTGGVLILRNKFFIIFYRGKDFIPPRVASLIVNRETELKRCQLEEESARWKAVESFHVTDETVASISTIGTFSDFRDIQTKYGLWNNGSVGVDVEIEAERERLEKELRTQKRKLFILKGKIEKSAKELAKLNSNWSPAEQAADHEMITQEERLCFRKIGLKMDKTLELGRRGIFDGVIESMHQHWKHREVLKVITMQRAFSQVIDTATRLETESGGILVAIESLRKGHAIILYRVAKVLCISETADNLKFGTQISRSSSFHIRFPSRLAVGQLTMRLPANLDGTLTCISR
ncbi:RNA-binding [Macleaya cordata]|uniref:RNA-binding n=1 Tax=Macleaya cordata TaxID=56857 RepID=A0A200Q3D2_MACCD|nr:RNA-binding [Macleaya cordata]